MLTGKTALITGSTSGIGLGIAKAMAGQGANIMLNGFGNAAQIEETRAGFEADYGIKAYYNAADMSKPSEIKALIAACVAEFGQIDVLVNNAGIQHVAPIDKFDDERWDAIIAINLSSCYHTVKHALPEMRANGWGRIINVASVHGLVGSVDKSAYVAAKHGVVGLTKVTALETAEDNITCNAICPGWVRTELVERQIEALSAKTGLDKETAAVELVSEKQPSKEYVTPEMLGELAVFLCSSASSQMTGVALPVDGGWMAR